MYKCDVQVFQEMEKQTNKKIQKIIQDCETSSNQTRSCANYMEKYMPMYI